MTFGASTTRDYHVGKYPPQKLMGGSREVKSEVLKFREMCGWVELVIQVPFNDVHQMVPAKPLFSLSAYLVCQDYPI